MASRAPLPGSPLTGSDLVSTLNARMATLFDAAAFPLASVAGSANAVTATLDPPLTSGLVTGMRFGITWDAENTGAVTLNINGGGAVPVLGLSGDALPAGSVAAGLRSTLEYVAGSFVLLTGTLAELGLKKYFVSLTTPGPGTFSVPSDLPDETICVIRLWGAGGGGAGMGGGGGAFLEVITTLGSLGASVSYNIGAGGSAGTAGGNTSFGTLGVAYGGGPGGAGPSGGGGGGTHEAGSGLNGGYQGGGDGATSGELATPAEDAKALWGGGGGGGGRAVFGGGGGGGGVSIFGGNGGTGSGAGQAPGGGGGTDAPGARGQIDIYIG